MRKILSSLFLVVACGSALAQAPAPAPKPKHIDGKAVLARMTAAGARFGRRDKQTVIVVPPSLFAADAATLGAGQAEKLSWIADAAKLEDPTAVECAAKTDAVAQVRAALIRDAIVKAGADGKSFAARVAKQSAGDGAERCEIITARRGVGRAKVLGAMKLDAVRSVVKAHQPDIQACFQEARKRKPDLDGQVLLKWVIDAKGAVGKASVERSELGDADLEKCLLDRVQTWTWPAPKSNIVIVEYPFSS